MRFYLVVAFGIAVVALTLHSAAPLASAVNLAHLTAMSTWLGGLALVAFCLRPASRACTLAAVMPRFSRLAFACLTTVVLTGTYLSWREVGSFAALRSTEYGRLLLVKLIGVLILVALGNLGRRWVQRHLPPSTRQPVLLSAAAVGIVPATPMTFPPLEYGAPELASLHRGVLAELGVAGSAPSQGRTERVGHAGVMLSDHPLFGVTAKPQNGFKTGDHLAAPHGYHWD